MGSKARFANEFLPLILKDRKPGQWFVEPFCGGCNVTDKVENPRLANDINHYIIATWDALVYRGWIPKIYTKEEYDDIKAYKDMMYEDHVVGWAGINCSFKGIFFSGFAGEITTKTGVKRDYRGEALRLTMKQVPKLVGVKFTSVPFNKLNLTVIPNSIIYCDPPYQGKSGYKREFDFDLYWNWIREMGNQGHTIFCSEYQAPEDFECIWEKSANSRISGKNTESIERLFKRKV